jgi:hypothetical protein
MVIKAANAFAWGSKPYIMVTLNEDIILDFAKIVTVNSRGHFGLKPQDLKLVSTWMVWVQCYQLAEISAAKHNSGPIKISAAGRNSGRIFCRFFKKWQKSGPTFFFVFFT